jgi:predicted nucleic acid-binding protein
VSEPHFLLDAGPLVAYFHPRDQYHDWARKTFDLDDASFVACEPVLVEAFYLLAKYPNGPDILAQFCESDALRIDFRLLDHMTPIRQLLQKYRVVPMSLADACLVLLAEQHPNATVITTDHDFLVYRTRSRRQIRILAPFS